MKRITLLSPQKLLVLVSFFIIGIVHSQGKKPENQTLFGQTIAPESINPTTGQIRCATMEYEKYLQQKNPKRMTSAQFETWLAPLVQKQKMTKANSKMAATIITIPVVVHVVHSGQAIGTAPNIVDAQVQSQITVLNQDYRKMLGTPGGESTNPVAADVEIEFVLAQQDPNGNPTNGIDRVNFCQSYWNNEDIDLILKPATIWDPTQYLNMWTVQFSDSSLLGYAQFPDASGLPGLSSSGGSATTDGVVSSYNVFGSQNTVKTFLLDKTYNQGRTMTHEVGHWLGLRHIWGDGNGSEKDNIKDCSATDYCNDTPQVGWEHYTCGSFDTCPSSPGNDMPENYMDYTNDACMNIFTQDQKTRITTIINNAARRSSLKTSTKASAIPLFANDAEVKIEAAGCTIDYACNNPSTSPNKQVALYNKGTTTLTSATLNYTINGGTAQNYTWTGSLAQNQSTVITLSNTDAYGILNVNVVSANGGTDQRASNNTASATFTAPSIPTNYSFTSFKFTLQQDKYGSETTWSLKNGSGTTIYSGGPYTDSSILPALLEFNWNLTNNQCYTFTINDSHGDGICCGGKTPSEMGSYSIKSSDGLTTVIAGSDFGYIDTKSFTVNTLGTNEFETSSAVYLYPNPTKGTLNIQIPSNLGLPNSYSISNALGQKISQKEVTKEADLTLNTSNLSNGIYFISIVKADQKRTLKFIKE